MATNIIQQTSGRAGQGRASQRAKRFFMVGILGSAILLALAVGLAAQQSANTQAVSEAPAAVAPSNPATGVSYRASAPNESRSRRRRSCGGAFPAAIPVLPDLCKE